MVGHDPILLDDDCTNFATTQKILIFDEENLNKVAKQLVRPNNRSRCGELVCGEGSSQRVVGLILGEA